MRGARRSYDSYLEQHGKPVALYSDKAGVFRVKKAQRNPLQEAVS